MSLGLGLSLHLEGGLISIDPAILYSATYTADNGTPLQNYVPEIGAQLTIHAGTWDIQSNQANLTTASGNPRATVEPGVSALKISGKLNKVGGSGIGLTIKRASETRWFLIECHTSVIVLYEFNISFIDRGTISYTYVPDAVLEVYVNGNTIAVLYNDTVAISYTDPNVNTGGNGAGLYASTANNKLDNVVIRLLDNPKYAESKFTGANGTLLSDYMPDFGSLWTVAYGVWKLLDGIVHLESASGSGIQYFSYVNPGVSDIRILADVYINAPASIGAGILFRYDSDTKWWLARIFNGNIEIYEYNSGWFLRASAVATYLDYKTIGVTVWKNSVAVSYGGVFHARFSGSGLSTGGNGSGIQGSVAGPKFDNFIVTKI
jgi:hypothetical protein